jgi:hypothetical protein
MTNKPSKVGIDEEKQKNYTFNLLQNYPNPFNPNTKITYQLENEDKVKLTVYDVLGREIITLVDESQKSGEHSVNWNGKNNSGEEVNSGIYFYKLTFQGNSITKKAVFIH